MQNFTLQREEMVTEQITARGIRDERVLAAMRKVERHQFVPESFAQVLTTTSRSRLAKARRSPSRTS